MRFLFMNIIVYV